MMRARARQSEPTTEASRPFFSQRHARGTGPSPFFAPAATVAGRTTPCIQRRERPDGSALARGDWTESDRVNDTATWKSACEYNLRNGRNGDYTRIIERRDFYRWFYNHTAALGYETRWALAASIVATGAYEIASVGVLAEELSPITNELQGMMREGNQVIFDNVFPKLLALLNGGPLTGRAALAWDMRILSEEQALIQPLYTGISADTLAALNTLARQRGVSGTVGSWLAPDVPVGPHNRGGSIPPFAETDITDVTDRWMYGMRLGSRFAPSPTLFRPGVDVRPAPGADYTSGAALARVRTRPNLHQLDAHIPGPSNPGDVTAILSRLTTAEQDEILGDRTPDGDEYSWRLRVTLQINDVVRIITPWRRDLERQMRFLGRSIFDRWSSLDYSQIAPMIRGFSQSQKNRLHTSAWRDVFIDVCDDTTIATAVIDLGLSSSMAAEWIDEERSLF